MALPRQSRLWDGLTPRAARAVEAARHAAAMHGCGEATPEALLLALLQQQDSTALSLLERLGVSVLGLAEAVESLLPAPSADSPSLPSLSPGARRVLGAAFDEARLLGEPGLGTGHLLLALASSDEPFGQVLQAHGITRALVCQELATRPRRTLDTLQAVVDTPRAPSLATVPPAVLWAVFFFGAQAFCTVCPLAGTAPFPTAGHGPHWSAVLIGAQIGWAWLCALTLAQSLLAGKRWAWAAAQGVLLVRTSAWLAFPAAGFLHALAPGNTPLEARLTGAVVVGALASPGVLLLLLTLSLFRAREWFGVQPKRAWTTIRREGWWALLLTALLDGGLLLGVGLSGGDLLSMVG